MAGVLFAAPAPPAAAPAAQAVHDHSAHDHGPDASADHADGSEHSAHEASEGLSLVAQSAPDRLNEAARCPDAAVVRRYEVAAIAVDITLNRYLDHDPDGRMYVLEEDLARVRDEERRNRQARSDAAAEPAVSLGLAADAIQPLTLRVNQGECLRIRLRNDLAGESASVHVHGSALVMSGSGRPALAGEPAAMVAPGDEATYEWMVPPEEPEATHYLHSHGDDRPQTSHGLFGAVLVEPAGSRHLDPGTGEPIRGGWAAVVQPPSGPAFREFTLYYHEVGDETYRVRDRADQFVPQVDPITGAYRPAARALNYRSEPFMNRLRLQQEMFGLVDESVAYSSYVFGDPATPVARSYLGDPVKQRVLHAGSEVGHVHHVHGGSIRWRRQTGVEPSRFDTGLDKHPPLVPEITERTDSQSMGPSETFDVENECGSGGCQQSVGDYLYHCHVAHHYIGGMWALWRVYNTVQDGEASTDGLLPLAQLPGRGSALRPAVTSDQLSLALLATVERQLPPPGVPRGFDASVLDWQRDGDRYLSEPETTRVWPGYRARAPGTRPPFTFDPVTGKLAYPFLRPHLGQRPPFPPGHNPSPYLEPATDGRGPAPPGSNGPDSLCPDGTSVKRFDVRAIATPVTLNERLGLVDPAGQLYVLGQDEATVRADDDKKVPLAVRANAGEHCIDVLLTSALEDNADNGNYSKVNLHIHFVQFDVQGSDGVIAGFNYEQSVRPFREEGETIADDVTAGARAIRLSSTDRFQPGVVVGVGLGTDAFEAVRVAAIEGDTLVLADPLARDHAAGQWVSTEFVRYRWYPDAQVGTSFFHDHVNALRSWRHGLFGALIVEPPGSTYHDPHTGAEIESGPLADIHTEGRVSADVEGSFREFTLFVQDDNPLTRVTRSTGGSFNLRVEPLDGRDGDPALAFSSTVHGDPATPIPEAMLGDPVVVRTLVSGTNEIHSVHVDGHWFRTEPWSTSSPPTSTIRLGISERYDLSIARAGGPQQRPGDYLYYDGRLSKLREGSWGLLRVRSPDEPGSLRPLPGRVPARPSEQICPAGAPRRDVAIAAIQRDLPILGAGLVFVLERDLGVVGSPHPLVLHANVGDCLTISLRNDTDRPVTFHPDLLAADPDSSGVAAGGARPQAAAPGGRATYGFYASPEVGPTVASVRDFGDVRGVESGLYGAIVIAPAGSTYRDPVTGADAAEASSVAVDVHPPGEAPYRDFTVVLHDDDRSLGTHRMPYSAKVDGVVGINYAAAPFEARVVNGATPADVLSAARHGDPPTPLLDTLVADRVRINVVAPASEQTQVFSVEGHRWAMEQDRPGSPLISSVGIAGGEAFTVDVVAGGERLLPGDYVYGNHRGPYTEAGAWGVLRVRFPTEVVTQSLSCLDPTSRLCAAPPGPRLVFYLQVAASISLIVLTVTFGAVMVWPGWWRRPRRGRPSPGAPIPSP